MTVKETHYLFGKLPIHSRTVKPSETYTIVNIDHGPSITGFEEFGEFTYIESRTMVTVKDPDTLNLLVSPPKLLHNRQYQDLMPRVESDSTIRRELILRKDQINTTGRFKGRMPFTTRKLTWKP